MGPLGPQVQAGSVVTRLGEVWSPPLLFTTPALGLDTCSSSQRLQRPLLGGVRLVLNELTSFISFLSPVLCE